MAIESWRQLPQAKRENLLENLRALTGSRDGGEHKHRLNEKLSELAERWEHRATPEALRNSAALARKRAEHLDALADQRDTTAVSPANM